MRFVIPSSLLSAHLQTIGRVIVQKNTLPILDCFKFETSGLQLTITASDSDSTMVAVMPMEECDADISFAVNAKTLQDAIKELPEQPLEFYVHGETLEVTICYQNGQYKIMGQDALDYPVPAENDEETVKLTVPAEQLLSGLSRAMVAAANDVLRPQLNTVCFDLKGNDLSLVSSNGNQLALTTIKGVNTEGKEGTFLLATRIAGLLRGMLAKQNENVTFELGSRGAVFSTSEYRLTCRLIEGRYPNYRSVIPHDNSNVVKVDRAGFISMLRRILVFANPGIVLVKLALQQGSLQVSTQYVDFGRSAEETMLCDYTGNPMHIAFKGNTLLDLVQHIDGDELSLSLSDPSRAGVIMPVEQKEGEEVLMLLMPSVFNG